MTTAQLTAPLLDDTMLQEEIALETQAVDDGVRRYRRLAAKAVERGDGASLKPAERLTLTWLGPMVQQIIADRRIARRGQSAVGVNVWGPILNSLHPDVIAVCALHETLSAVMKNPDGVKVSALTTAIGRAIIAEAGYKLLKQTKKDELKKLTRKFRSLSPKRVNWWANKHLDNPVHSRRAQVHVGSRLLWTVIESCLFVDSDPKKTVTLAFHLHYRYIKGKRVRFVVADNKLFDVIDRGHAMRQGMRPRYLPMIVPPYTWTADAQGGYVRIRTPLIAKPRPAQKRAMAETDLTELFKCLTAISDSAARHNAPLVKVIKRAIGEGGNNWPSIPRPDPIPKPVKPAEWEGLTDAQKKAWKLEAVKVHRANLQLISDREELALRLAVVDTMNGRPFYFPHQLDFRSRAYPIPTHVNFHSDDMARGMLEAADPKPPGEIGRKNLLLHAANTYGLDKASPTQRLAWADQNMEHMLKSAREPMDYDWWQHADESEPGAKDGKPWQMLAACFAVADPDGAGAHLPVQRDGTMNGLQHYSALGRDPIGAAAVNMMPSGPDDTPANAYGDVAKVVARRVNLDTIAGHEFARYIDGKVNRSLVKQNVMTKTYDVTLIGAARQVIAKLRKLGVPDEVIYKVATYLASTTLDSIGEVCKAAVEIMDCVRSWGEIITGEDVNQAIRWTTPVLGFPVVQPHRRYRSVAVNTILQDVHVPIDDENVPLARMKQCNSFAPSLIHSYDATHMFLTGRSCRAKGICFWPTHDAFRTHAVDADEMVEITKREFVNQHTPPLLELLHAEITQRYRVDFPPPPPRGDYDLNKLLQSHSFFN